MTRYLAIFTVAVLYGATPVHAQRAPPPVVPVASRSEAHVRMPPSRIYMPSPRRSLAADPGSENEGAPDRIGGMVVAGLGAAAVGMLAGIVVGADATNDFDGAAWGLVVGPMVTVPLAVILANRGRGAFGWMALGSLAVSAASLAVASTADSPAPLLIGPAVNVGVSTAIAHASSRRSR